MSEVITTRMDNDFFCLQSDLQQLQKVTEICAVEAMVFYAGRILESTSNYCVQQLGERAKSNVFSNLEYIKYYNLVDSATLYWSHALRRLANQFRHVMKPTETNDGAISLILLKIWLTWLQEKSQLLNEGEFTGITWIPSDSTLFAQLLWVEKWLKHGDGSTLVASEMEKIVHEPIFDAVLCEELINKTDYSRAEDYLLMALARHDADLRLNQLYGLLLSRTNRLQEAEVLLRRLLVSSPDDDETQGILAGVLKKMWQQGDSEKLTQWGKLYYRGWRHSRERNTYLGINAAAYALWTGDLDSSQTICRLIVQQYQHRTQTLERVLRRAPPTMSFWDQATLAEAYLLAGDAKEATRQYCHLFESSQDNRQLTGIPARQLLHHLSYLKIQNTQLEKLAQLYTA